MKSEERAQALDALEWIFKVADDHGKYTCSDEYELVKSALHSVEAEKEPDAYMDSWEYRDFQERGSGTVFSSPKHMGKSVPFYLRAACNQAQKEPVNLPPAKPDLDPVEAHKRGEFVSDVEVAYNEGWNDCRHAAMYQTEKDPAWISCEERLPVAEDKDMYGDVLWLRSGIEMLGRQSAGCPVDATHWRHSHNYSPAPPEHKPE